MCPCLAGCFPFVEPCCHRLLITGWRGLRTARSQWATSPWRHLPVPQYSYYSTWQPLLAWVLTSRWLTVIPGWAAVTTPMRTFTVVETSWGRAAAQNANINNYPSEDRRVPAGPARFTVSPWALLKFSDGGHVARSQIHIHAGTWWLVETVVGLCLSLVLTASRVYPQLHGSSSSSSSLWWHHIFHSVSSL